MTWNERRAARLRARADRLDPGGAISRLAFDGMEFSVTWEECCHVPYFNTIDVGAPLYILGADVHRMTDETTAVPAEDHGPFPVDSHEQR